MTNLQTEYMYKLISVARISKALAMSHALRNDVEEMTIYLRHNVRPTQQEINQAIDSGLDAFEVFG
jgi:hypothetical protein